MNSRDSYEMLTTDVLVIGSGVAGLSCIANLPESLQVTMICKDSIEECSTQYAQGGVACVIDPNDSFDNHIEDTLYAGAGLCDKEAVDVLVKEGQEVIRDIMSDIPFDKNRNGDIKLGKEGAHSHRRILHGDGDATGRVMQKGLIERAMRRSNIQQLTHHRAIDLVVCDGVCRGALVRDIKSHSDILIQAGAVVLATGGYSHIYQETTNPNTSTGDGVYLGLKAGAIFRDPEFVQFHPTALFMAGAPRFLITEAIRGEGAILKSDSGHAFMKDVHEMADLAPRDVVSRAIVDQMIKTKEGCVFLDMEHLDPKKVHDRFPNIAKFCEQYSLDIARQWIPVRPAAHYCMGGLATDIWGKTNVENLYACGEVASSGVHGANRLASNSLLEGLVFGRKSAQAISGLDIKVEKKLYYFKNTKRPVDLRIDIDDVIRTLKALLWRHVGVHRTKKGLVDTEKRIRRWVNIYLGQERNSEKWSDFESLCVVALAVCKAAQLREESRGAHYRNDFPDVSEEVYHSELSLKDLEI